MDVVIPVREGSSNEWLRFALRSFAANMPHGRVWIVGAKPSWARNVQWIRTRQGGTKYANTTLAVRTVCERADVSDEFILCNDDFFVMKPTPDVPVLHRGPVIAVERHYARIASGKYLRGMRETRLLLHRLGHANPLSYELHVPMVINKQGMLHALDVAARSRLDVVHKRTLYGSLNKLGGDRMRDPKVLTRGLQFPRNSQFLSTMPSTFRSGNVGAFIRSRFPVRSKYEMGRR